MTPGEIRRLRSEARAMALAAFPRALEICLANLDAFPRRSQVKILRAALVREHDPAVIADLVKRLSEVTS